MSSESSARTWYETPRSLEPPSGGAGVAGVVGNDYRGYYPHAGPTAHHPAAAAHYAHSKYTHRSPFFNRLLFSYLSLSSRFFFFLDFFSFFSPFFRPEKVSSRFNDRLVDVSFEDLAKSELKGSSRKGLAFFLAADTVPLLRR